MKLFYNNVRRNNNNIAKFHVSRRNIEYDFDSDSENESMSSLYHPMNLRNRIVIYLQIEDLEIIQDDYSYGIVYIILIV